VKTFLVVVALLFVARLTYRLFILFDGNYPRMVNVNAREDLGSALFNAVMLSWAIIMILRVL